MSVLGAPPGAGQKLAYASGALVDGAMFNALNTFLFFYLTTVTRLPVGLVAAILAGAVVADAIMAPLIGTASDRLRGRWGRRLPPMLVAVPLAGGSIFLLFTLPIVLPDMPAGLLAALCLVARLSLSLYQLPHLALGADMALSYRERSALAAQRWFFNIAGGLFVVLSGIGWHLADPARASAKSYVLFAGALGAVVATAGIAGCVAAFSLRRQLRMPQAALAGGYDTIAALAEVLRNRTFRLLLAGSGLFFTGFSIGNLLNLHAKVRFWQLAEQDIRLVLIAYFAGLLIASPLAAALVYRFEKKVIALAGLGTFIFVQAMPVVFRLAGFLPVEGKALVAALMLAGFVAGIALGMGGATLNSMMGDAADEHAALFGTHRQATFFSATAFVNKAANGLGILLAGFALDTLGTGSGVATVQAIGVLYGPVAGLLSALALMPLLLYRIDRTQHAHILAVLTKPK